MKQILIFTLLFIGIASLYAQNVPSYVPTDSLVGWWPFNGSANDESGNGNNGLVYGATQSQGIRGQSDHSYFFNGSSYIQIPSNPVFNFSGSHTISIWAKVVGTNTYQHFITRNEGSSFPIIEQFNLRRSTNAGFEAFTSPRGNQFYNQPIFSTSS